MLKTIHTTNDREALHPKEPVNPEPNAYMRTTIEVINPAKAKTNSLLQTTRSLELEGPDDWSSRIEDYIYRNESGMAAK